MQTVLQPNGPDHLGISLLQTQATAERGAEAAHAGGGGAGAAGAGGAAGPALGISGQQAAAGIMPAAAVSATLSTRQIWNGL